MNVKNHVSLQKNYILKSVGLSWSRFNKANWMFQPRELFLKGFIIMFSQFIVVRIKLMNQLSKIPQLIN